MRKVREADERGPHNKEWARCAVALLLLSFVVFPWERDFNSTGLHGMVFCTLKRGAVLPCEPCAGRTFRLTRYRERTFNVLSKSMRNEKDDIFCAGERESPARMRKFEGVKQFPKLRLS